LSGEWLESWNARNAGMPECLGFSVNNGYLVFWRAPVFPRVAGSFT
jgi:hypothetical protein